MIKVEIEEIMVKEEGKVGDLQNQIIEIMRGVLANLRKQFSNFSHEPFPIIAPDLVEMSNSEFESCLRSLPVNFTSDYLYDLRRLRRILAAFGQPSRTKILDLCTNFIKGTKADFFNYKGFL